MAEQLTRRDLLRKGATFGAAAAVATTSLAAFANDAYAQDVTLTATKEAEILALHESALAARDYATKNTSVGILLNVADDIATRPDSEAIIAKVSEHFKTEFAKRGQEIEVFTNRNYDAQATLLRYYFADKMYTIKDGDRNRANLDLSEANRAIDDVLEQLALNGKVASLNTGQAGPILENN
jgi:hypothetical protein